MVGEKSESRGSTVVENEKGGMEGVLRVQNAEEQKATETIFRDAVVSGNCPPIGTGENFPHFNNEPPKTRERQREEVSMFTLPFR